MTREQRANLDARLARVGLLLASNPWRLRVEDLARWHDHLRRRNLLPPERYSHRTPTGLYVRARPDLPGHTSRGQRTTFADLPEVSRTLREVYGA